MLKQIPVKGASTRKFCHMQQIWLLRGWRWGVWVNLSDRKFDIFFQIILNEVTESCRRYQLIQELMMYKTKRNKIYLVAVSCNFSFNFAWYSIVWYCPLRTGGREGGGLNNKQNQLNVTKVIFPWSLAKHYYS